MPSALERTGNFSQSTSNGPVSIYDPNGRTPFAGNIIPAARINPAATALLALFPLPNQPGSVQHFQNLSSVPSNSDSFSLRMGRSLGKKERLSGSMSMQQRSGLNTNLFGFTDNSNSRGGNYDLTWTHTFRAGFLSNLRVSVNRSRSTLIPFFAYGKDWAGQLGIQGASRSPLTFGPPNLSFTNFAGLSDGSPNVRADQNNSLSESFLMTKGKMTLSYGGGLRRPMTNSQTQSNARGTFTFTGLQTSARDANGSPLSATQFCVSGRPIRLSSSRPRASALH